jgi:hypothetical protein
MEHSEKIAWMSAWATKHNCQLTLQGKCGIGRECVGILVDGKYPDYEWWNDDTYEREDANGEVWAPDRAYHKHPCVAVLGRGAEAESQLYDWLKWFDDNGFTIVTGRLPIDPGIGMVAALLRMDRFSRMVLPNAQGQRTPTENAQ